MIIPAQRLIILLAIWVIVGVLVSVWPALEAAWWSFGGIILVAALTDLLRLIHPQRLTAIRVPPGRIALGVPQEVELTLTNSSRFAAHVRVMDSLPSLMESADLPWMGSVPANGFTTLNYRLLATSRGLADFGLIHVEQNSQMGFWMRRYRAGAPAQTKVYPNYEPVVRFALLSMINSQSLMGIRRINSPGISREFRQLRDYQQGDILTQVDWKATSRRMSLVSREYEEQRNQTIILVVDCGRRLRAMDGDLTQFDHCLNAMLLLSFIALRQGDHVGVMSFGSDPPRWLPPVKGAQAMPTILNHLFDYQAGGAPGDFGEAAETLLARWKRRAMVVIATNLRSEDETQMLAPLTLLRKKHLVVLASLREREVTAQLEEPIVSLRDAVRFGSTQRYFEERSKVLEKLHQANILTVDSPATTLPIALGNLYLSIKKRGLL